MGPCDYAMHWFIVRGKHFIIGSNDDLINWWYVHAIKLEFGYTSMCYALSW